MEFKLVKFKDWLILLFSREGGDLLQHIFNAPPENLDGVDRVYLEGKLKCKLSMKEVKFIVIIILFSKLQIYPKRI